MSLGKTGLKGVLCDRTNSSCDGVMTTTSLFCGIIMVEKVRNHLKYLPLERNFSNILRNRCNHQTKTRLTSKAAVLLQSTFDPSETFVNLLTTSGAENRITAYTGLTDSTRVLTF